ncbi:MAG: hypothetical protein Q4D38_09705 [Planctomycetia bacterium]|nr:hypothetical protein [Planctomycetia bacterium]
MIFQFYCPQGHLLQGDTAHAGQAIACPMCGIQFIIPQPPPSVAPVVTPVTPSVAPITTPTTPTPQIDLKPRRSSGGPNLNDLLGGKSAANPIEATFVETVDEDEEEPPLAEIFGTGGAPVLSDDAKIDAAMLEKKKAEQLSILHIPCPKGHVLEVPRDMIGEKARCPYCKTIYSIEFEKSLEYRKEQQELREREEARLGRIWLTRAIIATVLVVLFIILMISLT